MPRPGPLRGLKVLDLSRLLPGPYATLVLADLGADVVKVEEPQGGDYARWMPPMAGGTSGLFLALNRGKRSIALDLRRAEDRSTFLELARAADVVVESFRPGVLAKLGIGWETLRALNPRLVLCSITGFGQAGPWADRAGHDLGYLALGGLLGLMGTPDKPAQANAQLADVGGGSMVALVGILAALLERQRTGVGRWVDTSMTEGAMSASHMLLGSFLATGEQAPRAAHGPISGESPCYSIYRTSDNRYLAVGALEPKFWSAFCRAAGLEHLEGDGLSAGDDAVRVKAVVQEVIGSKPLSHWAELFAQVDACVEPVLRAGELRDHPAHASRNTFFDGPHGPMQRTPVRFVGDEPAPAASPAPGLGQNRDEILQGWLGR